MRELFTTLTIHGNKESNDLVKSYAGIGSRGHDFIGDFVMILVSYSDLTGVKASTLHVDHETGSGM